ncbi:MAG: hypothetical protein Q4P71_03180 [Actinomycetaceae bacterium]|nr:hypothetical protein [Actinomycetaceae bacterium]
MSVEPNWYELSEAIAASSIDEHIRLIDPALIDLRFTEGLRRNWEAARAETNIQLAYTDAALDGARVNLNHLRLASIGRAETTDPGIALAVDYWRAHLWISQIWNPLNARRPVKKHEPPLPVIIASVHKLLSARLVGTQVSSSEVAIPSDPARTQVFIRLLSSSLPAAVRCALAVAWAHHNPFFTRHCDEVARVVIRHLLVTSGFEPTGTLLLTYPWVAQIDRTNAVLDAVDWHDPETVVRWVERWIEMLGEAVDPTLTMIRHVQAGTPFDT